MNRSLGAVTETEEPSKFVERLTQEAKSLGFALFGIAPAVTPAGFHHLVDWIEAGYAADMAYIEKRLAAYRDPSLVLRGARSIIVLGFPYRTAEPNAADSHEGRVARYAWGAADYHDLLHDRLKQLKKIMVAHCPGSEVRGVVDSAPIMEREFAQLAGLGWAGKNSLLLNRSQGSYFFLSCLLTTLSLPATAPFETDHCGSCTRCLDACPTQAFVSPGVLDSGRCISYQTIENRDVIPIGLREQMGNWVFGCDVCQEVCPWNRFGDQAEEPLIWPLKQSNPIDLLELLALDDAAFRDRFRKTPLWRPRRRGLLRNAAICLGNARERKAIPSLVRLLDDEESIIRGAVAWSLGRMGGERAYEALKHRFAGETDTIVKNEILDALQNASSASSE